MSNIRQALGRIAKGEFEQGFAELADAYAEGQRDPTVLRDLKEAFWKPNLDEMERTFQKNVTFLKKYPFLLTKNFVAPTENDRLLFPLTDELFYCFDQRRQVLGPLTIESERETRYFFKDLDQPLFVKSEYNLFNLRFLRDNVRRSEDFAGDNHIYLHYDDADAFSVLLYYSDMEALCTDEKFVILIGNEKDLYPLDFKKRFGIDYAACQPREISVNEIKRMIFGWKIANASGTSFFADIMDFHPELLTIPDCVMYSFADLYAGQLKGKTRSEAISFLRRLSDKDSRKSGIMSLVRNHSKQLSESLREEFNRVSAEEFLTVLESVLAEFPCPSAREWLIGIFLTYSRCHGRSFGRVIPALFLYPHDDMFYLAGVERDKVNFYFDLVGSFPYHKVIAVIRNPVTQAGAVANFMTRGHWGARNAQGEIQLDPFYCVAFGSILPKDYYFPLQHPLRESIRVVRFEDLKLNPKATFASMAEFLNIPVTQSMFQTTWCGLTRMGITTENTVFEGFDPAPVYKSYDQYLSVFDKYRIELLLRNRIEIYGYRAKCYDGQQFSDEDIVKMMELPFLCESIKTIVPPARKRSSRETGMQFIKFAAAIKEFPFSINGGTDQFAPLLWLRPKEELLEQPLYH